MQSKSLLKPRNCCTFSCTYFFNIATSLKKMLLLHLRFGTIRVLTKKRRQVFMVFKFLILGAALGCSCTTFASEDLLFSHSEQDKMSGFESGIPDNSSYTSPTGSPPNNGGGMVLSSESLGGSSESTLNANAQSPEQLAFEEVLSGKRPLFPETFFESEYGKLTLHAVSLHENLNIAGWLRDRLETVFKEAREDSVKKWTEICKVLNEIYHCSDESAEAVPELFWDDLDDFYAVACLQLAEGGVADVRFNLWRAFCTPDRDRILRVFDFEYDSKIHDSSNIKLDKNSEAVFLSTAGVYLYALSKFLKGYRDSDHFRSVYKKPISALNQQAPKDNFVSWALFMAASDTETQDLVKKQKPVPSLF